ncbi:MAG: hypothetical protein ACOX4H_07225 [Bacillota bacterium]|jgi:hypothetical protein|nr:hypothetical protein [Clostridia bacterium]
MRRRRKARRIFGDQSLVENQNEHLNDDSDSPSESPNFNKKPEEFSPEDLNRWKDVDIHTIIKCEADFFCQVLRRLLKEIHCARDLDDLDDIISLSAKFLEASAAKEQAIACQIAVSKGMGCPTTKKSSCICDLGKDPEKKKY